MSYCSKCGTPLDASSKFCPGCGTLVESAQTPDSSAWNSVPQTSYSSWDAMDPYSTPGVFVPPVVTGKAKALGFVGMALSIVGFILACIGLLATVATMEELKGVALGMSIGYGIFALPMVIVGLALSKKSKNLGFTSAAPTAGVVLGIIGIILVGVMLVLGCISLETGRNAYSYYGGYYGHYY